MEQLLAQKTSNSRGLRTEAQSTWNYSTDLLVGWFVGAKTSRESRFFECPLLKAHCRIVAKAILRTVLSKSGPSENQQPRTRDAYKVKTVRVKMASVRLAPTSTERSNSTSETFAPCWPSGSTVAQPSPVNFGARSPEARLAPRTAHGGTLNPKKICLWILGRKESNKHSNTRPRHSAKRVAETEPQMFAAGSKHPGSQWNRR